MAMKNPMIVMSDSAGRAGRATIEWLKHYLDLSAFAWRMIRELFRWPREGRSLLYRVTLEQVYFTAVQALRIVIPVALILGTSFILQFSKVSGQIDLGKIVVVILVRETGPLVTALIVILRSATAVTIETGYMNVLREMETLEMGGMDPVRLYALPRLIGMVTAMVCLVFIFTTSAILGGYAIVWLITNVPMQNFLLEIAKALTPADYMVSALKAVFFGGVIAVVSLYRGFSVGRAITEVPVATSKGAVECLIYCMIISGLLSALFYM
ncbi:MAG TPA: ABC transporter permease [Syntrophales bacterium]|jgi:phospholipid/cholesterol/gamma-HCH transport system permease protein|nr:ABC transporter permease [Syntrophales bacterium]HRT61135.1 ABC transporter permease [Syntrophales bacterium]